MWQCPPRGREAAVVWQSPFYPFPAEGVRGDTELRDSLGSGSDCTCPRTSPGRSPGSVEREHRRRGSGRGSSLSCSAGEAVRGDVALVLVLRPKWPTASSALACLQGRRKKSPE